MVNKPVERRAQHHSSLEDANQNDDEMSPHTIRTAATESEDESEGADLGQPEPLCPTGGNAKWCGSVENGMDRFLRKLKIEFPAIQQFYFWV